MIRVGSSGIEDVKFGNQQVSKVYHGADLVWEKDGYTNLLIGDNFIVSAFETDGSSTGKKTGCGFTLNAHSSAFAISGVFDGSINTGVLFANTSSSSNDSVAHIMIGFPFPVLLQSVTIIDCDDAGNCIQYGGSTDISTKKGFAEGKLYFSTVAESGFFAGSDNAPANTLDSGGRGIYFSFGRDSRTNYTRSVCRNANWNSTEARAVDLKITKWKSSTTKQYEAEMKLDVLVKTSVYNAWKNNRENAAALAAARNGAGARIV